MCGWGLICFGVWVLGFGFWLGFGFYGVCAGCAGCFLCCSLNVLFLYLCVFSLFIWVVLRLCLVGFEVGWGLAGFGFVPVRFVCFWGVGSRLGFVVYSFLSV